MIDIDITCRVAEFELDCRFTSDARTTGVFGASGAGKSSLLAIMAGLLTPDRGRVSLAGRCVFDSERRIDRPAHKRRIGMVFQQPRLFAHRNVRANLTYGRRFAPRGERGAPAFDDVVELLELAPLLARRVARLSGGEQQRVAIGRALLANPAVLLLDEPLASLDAGRKHEVLPYIERLSAETRLPIVFVSHRLDELLRLARHHVVALRDGAIAYAGPTADFLARPELLGPDYAEQAGTLLSARIERRAPDHGLTRLDCEGQTLYVPRLTAAARQRVTLHVRARDVMLARRYPHEISALNILAVTLDAIEPVGDATVHTVLRIGGQRLDARITRRSARTLNLTVGEPIYAVIKSLALADHAWQRLTGL